MIAHPDFIDDNLKLLVQARRAQGYKVKVVDVESVYAEFGHHAVDANAIKAYIRYAANKLGVRMVLLVGGDTYDYMNYLNNNAVSFIPSLYTQTDHVVRFAPSDTNYADIDNDDLPDIAIGRLPVRTSEELAAAVRKTLAYAQRDYNGTSVFAADRYDTGQLYSFTRDAEHMISQMPSDWQAGVVRAYVDTLGVSAAAKTITNAITNGVSRDGRGRWPYPVV